jgi:integrase
LEATERDDVWQRWHAGKRERDRLLLALFAYAGLRRSELVGLDWDDGDLNRRLIRVRKAKGGRQRIVPIHAALEPLFLAMRAFGLPHPRGLSNGPASQGNGLRASPGHVPGDSVMVSERHLRTPAVSRP